MDYKYKTMSTNELGSLFNMRAEEPQGCTVNYDHRDIIRDMTADDYEYVGWIPVTYGGHGQLKMLDLVFRKED